MDEQDYYEITDSDGNTVRFLKYGRVAEIGSKIIELTDDELVGKAVQHLNDVAKVEGTTSFDSRFHKGCEKLEDEIRRELGDEV